MLDEWAYPRRRHQPDHLFTYSKVTTRFFPQVENRRFFEEAGALFP
jgi:hypothetical protein